MYIKLSSSAKAGPIPTAMADEVSFESLAQQYGIAPGGYIEDAEVFARGEDIDLQYSDQHAQGYPGAKLWQPGTATMDVSDASLQPQQPQVIRPSQGSLAVANHLRVDRAETAESKVDPFQCGHNTGQLSRSCSTLSTGVCKNMTGQRRENDNVETDRLVGAFQPPQQGSIYAEPKPGRRVALVPVSILRE